MIYAATGHRPEELGGYDKFEMLVEYAVQILPSYAPSKLILGMALGWDQAVALACIQLSVPFIAALPFKGQESIWPMESKLLFATILKEAAEVIIVCEGGYAPWKMQKRNEWMVDHSVELIALWNGNKTGGTANCVKYAEKKKVPMHNVWAGWEGMLLNVA